MSKLCSRSALTKFQSQKICKQNKMFRDQNRGVRNKEAAVKWIKNEVPTAAGVINENKTFHIYRSKEKM